MGLFDKKYCDICGEKIGLLGNRKLDDGNLCRDCAKKLSPWFTERRHSTVEEIKRQLAYREANKEKVRAFRVARSFPASGSTLFIDDAKGQFAVGDNLNEAENPDIVELSAVTGCRLDVQEHRDEEEYRDSEGEMRSYSPPRYRYSFDYSVEISVNSPYFDGMSLSLNSEPIDGNDKQKLAETENRGNEIVAALSPGGAPGRQPERETVRAGQPVPPASPNAAWTCVCGAVNTTKFCSECGKPEPEEKTGWTCVCGAVNTTKFCTECGRPKPEREPSPRCRSCGWEPEDPRSAPKFCPNCGSPLR